MAWAVTEISATAKTEISVDDGETDRQYQIDNITHVVADLRTKNTDLMPHRR
ncbi:MAG TPA: hypothetical protein VGC05_13185 [Mycobacterium sp.]